jgi:hypothetical protein
VIRRLLIVVVVLGAAAACAARLLWLGPFVVDEYANVRVRVYRGGRQCRIEIITATEMIQTPVTRCIALPLRPRTD